MGDPSSGSSPPADFGVDNQSSPFLLTGIHPFLQAPLLGVLPGLATFSSSLPVAPHAEAQGPSPLSPGTGGPSCQVHPLSVGQPPCPSTVSFEPTTAILLSGQSAPLPQGSSVVSHARVSPPSPAVASRPLLAVLSSPSRLAIGPRAEAFTFSPPGSPVRPPLLALPDPPLPTLESFVFPTALDSSALAALAQQVQSISRLAQEMQALAQAMQSQLSALAPSAPAPSAPFPVVPPSRLAPPALP